MNNHIDERFQIAIRELSHISYMANQFKKILAGMQAQVKIYGAFDYTEDQVNHDIEKTMGDFIDHCHSIKRFMNEQKHLTK